MSNNNNTALPFTIGADPELTTSYVKQLINARPTLHAYLSQEKDLAYQSSYGSFKHDSAGEIGWEGDALIELNPQHDTRPSHVAQNIGTLLSLIHKQAPMIDISSLPIGAVAGGHIHVCNPKGKAYLIDSTEKNLRLRNEITRIIATYLLPIALSEHKICSAGRAFKTTYGDLMDVRFNENDGVTTEIRGLTSEWLTTEKLCRATLAYVGMIWHEVINNTNKLIRQPFIIPNHGAARALQLLVCGEYAPATGAIMNAIRRSVRTFELYKHFAEDIEYILSPKRTYADKARMGWNIANGWNLSTKHTTQKRCLLSDRSTKARLKRYDIDSLKNTAYSQFGILVNNDTNIEKFADALRERAIAHKWTLKNIYCLFGMRKGIQGFFAAPLDQTTGEVLRQYSRPLATSVPDNYDETLSGLMNRFNVTLHGSEYINNSMPTVDPSTGRLMTDVTNAVMIGIPHEARAELSFKAFIDLIWNIENDKLTLMTNEDIHQQQTANGKKKQIPSWMRSHGEITDTINASNISYDTDTDQLTSRHTLAGETHFNIDIQELTSPLNHD